MSFVEFYVFLLDEIHVIYIRYKWVGDIRKIIPKDHERVLEERPKIIVQAVLGIPWRRSTQRPVVAVTPHQRVQS